MSIRNGIILVNFGGPRSLDEVTPFLTELLTDVDVVRTPFPRFFHRWFFKKVAIKRSQKVSQEYAHIGGKSPIFEDTEAIAEAIGRQSQLPVLTFHRYLTATHLRFYNTLQTLAADRFFVLPMYPQFSYSTTGSIARFFSKHLPPSTVEKMQWIKSYATHRHYTAVMERCIRDFLLAQSLKEKDVFLFFSAHGLPQEFVDQGDPYALECHRSYDAIRRAFPQTPSVLAFQSKFGPGEWLRPYTSELSQEPHRWNPGKQHIVFVPLSFTSDHLETLFEIENNYLPPIRQKGLNAYRCPALNRRPDWIHALIAILSSTSLVSNHALIRQK